jgi:hypothetical protein
VELREALGDEVLGRQPANLKPPETRLGSDCAESRSRPTRDGRTSTTSRRRQIHPADSREARAARLAIFHFPPQRRRFW